MAARGGDIDDCNVTVFVLTLNVIGSVDRMCKLAC